MLQLLKSSIVKKFIMGLTGLGLVGFVFGHMTGNFLIFKGAEAYNTYGYFLTSNPAYPLIAWGLVGCVALHVLMGILLAKENNAAKGGRYAVAPNKDKESSFASNTMAYTGILILFFISSHLYGMKYGTYYEVTYDGVVMRDLHRLVVEIFQSPLNVFWYVVSLVFLGIHLSHGTSSIFQSLGFNHPRYTPAIKCIGVVYAVVVALGFISQPLYVYFVH